MSRKIVASLLTGKIPRIEEGISESVNKEKTNRYYEILIKNFTMWILYLVYK